MCSGRRGSSAPAVREVKTFGSSSESARRRTCVGASSGEGRADSVRGLPPPVVKDNAMDLNHEFRFADFWRTMNERRSDVAVRRAIGREWRTGFSSESVL